MGKLFNQVSHIYKKITKRPLQEIKESFGRMYDFTKSEMGCKEGVNILRQKRGGTRSVWQTEFYQNYTSAHISPAARRFPPERDKDILRNELLDRFEHFILLLTTSPVFLSELCQWSQKQTHCRKMITPRHHGFVHKCSANVPCYFHAL